jgi:hypothetical protein
MRRPTLAGVSRCGFLAGLALIAALVAGCGPAPATATPPKSTAVPTAAPGTRSPVSASPAASVLAPASGSPTASAGPGIPEGSALADVPEAGIRLPVPEGWDLVPPEDLRTPEGRRRIAERYPGSASLLDQVDRLGERAAPVFLAVDPSDVSGAVPFAADLSVMATRPSVGGFLLDVAAGFIGDGIAETLGAPAPSKTPVDLPIGEAIRLDFSVPSDGTDPVVAVAWVIGAPEATLLVTLLGGEAALAGLDPDAIAAGIVPLADPAP